MNVLLVALGVAMSGAVIFFAVWLARKLYDQYRERIIFVEVAIVFVALGALLILMGELSERLAGPIMTLFVALVVGYCAWRGKRRNRLNGIRLREQLEDEYLAEMGMGDCDKATTIAKMALGNFPAAGALDYFQNYSHIKSTIEFGLSTEELLEWNNRWQTRLARGPERSGIARASLDERSTSQ